jgi:hypothetical protein
LEAECELAREYLEKVRSVINDPNNITAYEVINRASIMGMQPIKAQRGGTSARGGSSTAAASAAAPRGTSAPVAARRPVPNPARGGAAGAAFSTSPTAGPAVRGGASGSPVAPGRGGPTGMLLEANQPTYLPTYRFTVALHEPTAEWNRLLLTFSYCYHQVRYVEVLEFVELVALACQAIEAHLEAEEWRLLRHRKCTSFNH